MPLSLIVRSIRPIALSVAGAALTCAGVASAAPGDAGLAVLDSHIAFADPARCAFTDATQALIGGFAAQGPEAAADPITAIENGTWVTPGHVPDHLRDYFGPIDRVIEEDLWVIRTEVRGTLWSLPLTMIEQHFPGLDGGGVTFVFEAPLAAVEQAARAHGLTARAGVVVPLGEPDGYARDMTLEPADDDARLSRLTCGWS